MSLPCSSQLVADGSCATVKKKKAEKLALFSQAVSASDRSLEEIGEYLKLAKSLITILRGCFADERVFSALDFCEGRS